MALDKVIKAILEDGRKEAERIIAEGRKEAAQGIDNARLDAEKLVREKSDEADRSAKRMLTQETARAEIEAKKTVLRAQKEFLDEVYRTALARLGERWGSKLVETTLKERASDVKGGFVYSNQRDGAVAERLAASYGGKFGGTIDCLGGVVIESSDRSVRMDFRLETLLKDVWEGSVTEVAAALWGKE